MKHFGFLPRLQDVRPPVLMATAAASPSTPTSSQEDHPEMEVPEVTDAQEADGGSASAGPASAGPLPNEPERGGCSPTDVRFLQQEKCIVRLQDLFHALHGRVMEQEHQLRRTRNELNQLRRLVKDLKVCDGIAQTARGGMQADLEFLLDNQKDTRDALQAISKGLDEQESLTRLHSMQLQSLGMDRAWSRGPVVHEQGQHFPQWHGFDAIEPVAVFLAIPM